jgi:hypothetical protein
VKAKEDARSKAFTREWSGEDREGSLRSDALLEECNDLAAMCQDIADPVFRDLRMLANVCYNRVSLRASATA